MEMGETSVRGTNNENVAILKSLRDISTRFGWVSARRRFVDFQFGMIDQRTFVDSCNSREGNFAKDTKRCIGSSKTLPLTGMVHGNLQP